MANYFVPTTVRKTLSRSNIITFESDAKKYLNKLEDLKAQKDTIDKYLTVVNTLTTPLIFFPQVAAVKAMANILLLVSAVSSFADISNNYPSMIAEARATHASIMRCRNLVENLEASGKKVSSVTFDAIYHDKYVNSKNAGRYLVGANTVSIKFTDGTSLAS